ncbi:MAG TPA: pyridoxamine 5'-phosphate oxidase [Capillimicrobium sp.]|nr:pyridoxamine 5'-phosphate oxidase [Capillimicrobium sp.]
MAAGPGGGHDPHDLRDLRGDYGHGELLERDVAPTWHEQFERWVADALVLPGVEPNAMVFATADAAARPSVRTVLLKEWDERGFVLYTNLGSRKAREATENPRASLLFPWLRIERQVIVEGAVERVDDAQADAYFATRPRGSQLGAHASPQSRRIAGRAELEERRRELEARYPAGTRIPRPPEWGGLRVVPDAVEFWQGRPDRLHDRLRFEREPGGGWSLHRLAP